MPNVTTELATPDRWNDVQHALTGGGDGRSCQCGWWTLTNAEFGATSVDDRRDRLRGELDIGPPPGIIAYVDNDAAGWVRVGPRTAQTLATFLASGFTEVALRKPGRPLVALTLT